MTKDNENTSEKALFPLEVFPEFIRELIQASEEALNFPAEITASGILSATGIGLGEPYRVKVPIYEQKAISWICVVAPPGSSKSHAIGRALKPFEKWSFDQAEEADREMREWKESESSGRSPKKFASPFLTEATPEAVVNSIDRNPRGIVTYSDELTTWFQSLSRYTGNGAVGLANTLWNGNGLFVERKTAPSIRTRESYWTLIGGIQPRVLSMVFNSEAMLSGMFDRFSFVFPRDLRSTPYSRQHMVPGYWEHYNRSMDWLLNQSQAQIRGNPLVIHADSGAWETAYNLFSFKVKDHDPEDPRSGLPKKSQTMLSRWSLILHALDRMFAEKKILTEKISEETVSKAYTLTNYFYENSLRAYDLITNSSPVDSLSGDKKVLLEALPFGDDFRTHEAVEKARQIEQVLKSQHMRAGLSERTVKTFLGDKKFFINTAYGYYRRIL